MFSIFKLAFAIPGFGALASSQWLKRMNARAAGWPSVEGEIVTSTLDYNVSHRGVVRPLTLPRGITPAEVSG